MSLYYAINRFMGLTETNFEVADMDVKPYLVQPPRLLSLDSVS